jgi:hypothetical protein
MITLGITIQDVGACLFALWVCIDFLINIDALTEVYMIATFKTGVNALTVLWA